MKSTIDSVGVLNPDQILTVKTGLNYSDDLNKAIETIKDGWIFYIKDNEILVQNDLQFENEIYGCQILQDDIITKEPRIWNKNKNLKFKNPIFEKLTTDSTKISDTIIYQKKFSDPNVLKILDLWKNPFAIDAYYYKAFHHLGNKNFKEFKSLITCYLFHSKETVTSIMARYYLAFVQGIIDNETEKAAQNILLCLANNPLMAEFWCLLGDLFVKNQNFAKAMCFYENAQILGNRRLKLDKWPMQISKYNEYPSEMIDKCNKLLSNSQNFQVHSQ